MKNNKEKYRFVSRFIKLMVEATKTGGYIASDIFNVWAMTSYKGIRMKNKSYSSTSYYRGLYNFKSRGLIKINKGEISVTNKGRVWLKKSYLKYLREIHPKWDNKWRVVIFDIPQEFHTNRNRFRHKLRSLGFFMLQKSIFVFPYPCEEELAEICRNFRVSDYIDIIIADSIGFRKEEIEKFFEL